VLTLHPQDESASTEVYLRFLAGQHSRSAKLDRLAPVQTLGEPADAGVADGKALLGY
jgi:hypothetical protein